MINSAPALTVATYAALLISVFALWFGKRLWLATLAVAVVLGYMAGVLFGPAAIWIALFLSLCAGYDAAKTLEPRRLRIAVIALAATGIIVLGVLLGMHAAGGFRNFLLLDTMLLSPGAAPYSLYLNFDKTVVGLGILGLCYRGLLGTSAQWKRALSRAAPIVGVLLIVAVSAMAIGYVGWQPKWKSVFSLWAPVNLFFVCLSEEAFFRGFIQRELTKYGAVPAIGVSAVLFGLAHFGGGITYVVLATVAGVGYGIVFHRTKSIEMSMLAHFALNTTHFLLFTYPKAV